MQQKNTTKKTASSIVVVLKTTAIALCCLCVACDRGNGLSEHTTLLASVDNLLLTKKQVCSEMPGKLKGHDSLHFSEALIANWVKEQLWLRQAKLHLNDEMSEIEREVEEYRNSLLIYRFQQKIVEQQLDTVITDHEVEEYYSQHLDIFRLEEPILRVVYVQVGRTIADHDKIKRLATSATQEDLLALEGYCFQYATKYDNIDEKWVRLSTIRRWFSSGETITEDLLGKTSWFESTDLNYYRCLFIKEFRQKNQKAPINFVRDQIENLILNNRKLELIKNLEFELHQNARKNGSLKHYN